MSSLCKVVIELGHRVGKKNKLLQLTPYELLRLVLLRPLEGLFICVKCVFGEWWRRGSVTVHCRRLNALIWPMVESSGSNRNENPMISSRIACLAVFFSLPSWGGWKISRKMSIWEDWKKYCKSSASALFYCFPAGLCSCVLICCAKSYTVRKRANEKEWWKRGGRGELYVNLFPFFVASFSMCEGGGEG